MKIKHTKNKLGLQVSMKVKALTRWTLSFVSLGWLRSLYLPGPNSRLLQKKWKVKKKNKCYTGKPVQLFPPSIKDDISK